MNQSFDFKVNGLDYHVEADENDALLYVLRNNIKCKGVRFGCGVGHCGACTVLMEDRAVQSCDMPLWGAAGHAFTTVEKLADDPVGAVVLEEFLTHQAGQCGYCVNGILISVTALLKRSTSPTEAELQEALHRHLCRCGAHPRMLLAIKAAAERVHNMVAV